MYVFYPGVLSAGGDFFEVDEGRFVDGSGAKAALERHFVDDHRVLHVVAGKKGKRKPKKGKVQNHTQKKEETEFPTWGRQR